MRLMRVLASDQHGARGGVLNLLFIPAPSAFCLGGGGGVLPRNLGRGVRGASHFWKPQKENSLKQLELKPGLNNQTCLSNIVLEEHV